MEPGNALLHLEHGQVLLKLDDAKSAVRAFGKAAKLRPSLAEAQEYYGVLQLEAGEIESAVEPLRKTTELRPKSGVAFLHYANGLRAAQKYKEAEAAYTTALDLDKTLTVTHFNLGLMYLDNEVPEMDYLDRLEKAKSKFEEFRDSSEVAPELDQRLDDYEKTLKKAIKRETKKRKRAARRKAIEEEEKAEAATGDEASKNEEGVPADGGEEEGPGEGGEAQDADESAAPDNTADSQPTGDDKIGAASEEGAVEEAPQVEPEPESGSPTGETSDPTPVESEADMEDEK